MSLKSALNAFDQWKRQFPFEEQQEIESEMTYGLDKASELFLENFCIAYERRKEQEFKKKNKPDIKLVDESGRPKGQKPNIVIAKG